MTVLPYGVRLAWADLPARVRAWVGEQLGAPVVDVVTRPVGFSPGVATRVVSATGRRAFVKAVGPEPNPDTAGLHRREAAVLAALPAGLPAPRLLAALDEDGWAALLLEDVAGRHPGEPWTPEEAAASLGALEAVAAVRAPADWPDLAEELAGRFTAWSRIAQHPPADLDPWAARRIGELDELAQATLARLGGEHLVHRDSRADNLLVEPSGRVRVLDWPWAARGAPWFDAASLLVNIRSYGDLDVAPLLPRILDLGAAREDVLGVAAGLAGLLAEASRRPPAPGLPTLRAFQRNQEEAAYRLLRELL